MAGTKPKTKKTPQKSKGKAKPGKMAAREDTAKIEKKRAKLLARSQELEKEAHKLLAEAKKAADKYAELTKSLEEEDDDTSSESDSDEDVVTSSSSSSTSSSSDSSSEGGAAIPPTPKAKPAKKSTKDKRKPERKRKRASSSSSDDTSSDSSDSEADQKAAKNKSKKENKSKSKDKKANKKAKEEKKGKKKTQDTDSDSDSGSEDEETPAAAGSKPEESWHVTNLDGGSARQSKFLRLLGGKKQGVSLPEGGGASKSASESARAEADIQRQFEDGMRMKNDGGSHRRGLGMSG